MGVKREIGNYWGGPCFMVHGSFMVITKLLIVLHTESCFFGLMEKTDLMGTTHVDVEIIVVNIISGPISVHPPK